MKVTHMEIDLGLALAMCEAARESAGTSGALVSVAVVDAGGHLVAFTRMDGAEIGGGVPRWAGDRVVGGVGVSGGAVEQDVAAAEAGLAVYLEAEAAS